MRNITEQPEVDYCKKKTRKNGAALAALKRNYFLHKEQKAQSTQKMSLVASRGLKKDVSTSTNMLTTCRLKK